MQPTKKNYTYRRQEINAHFQLVLQHLFIGTYNGTKCNNTLVSGLGTLLKSLGQGHDFRFWNFRQVRVQWSYNGK